MHPPPEAKPADRPRIIAVDVFRGVTIAGMILVNNPGSWQTIYAPLRHAEWHGCTPTDLVFPFFLFIVGVSIVLSLQRRRESGTPRGPIVGRVLRRGAILFGLGMFLAAFPFVRDFDSWAWKDFSHLRIPGVLQRIAICYVVVSLLFLRYRVRTLQLTTVGLLLLYWGLMTLVPVPGHGSGMIDQKDTHLAAYIDRLVLGDHLWVAAKTWDPEGILSTIPALATTLFGVFAGLLLVEPRGDGSRARDLLIRGFPLVVLGYVWGEFFPINKPLWTSSYAVFTAGQAMCGLALCLWVVGVLRARRVAHPFVVYGVNAITVFVMSGVIGRLMAAIKFTGDGDRPVALKTVVYDTLYTSWIADPHLASLAFALTWVTCWYVVLAAMYHRGVVIKVDARASRL